jgi:hypothetical protein
MAIEGFCHRLLGAGLALTFAAAAAVAQDLSRDDPIETDRDSFTPATTIAGPERWIVESAYTFLDHRREKDAHSVPELLVRYGLTDVFELRLGWNYEVGDAGNDISGLDGFDETPSRTATLERESRVAYGLKAAITDQIDWIPRSAVLLHGFTPTSGESSQSQFAAAYVFGWELARGWQLDSALRYAAGGTSDDRSNGWAPSVVLKAPLGERVNVHAEYFGIFSDGRADEFSRQYFSPCVHYLITPDLELGMRLGWGLSDDSSRFFSNVGLGWRF